MNNRNLRAEKNALSNRKFIKPFFTVFFILISIPLFSAPPELKVSGKYIQTLSGCNVRLVGVNMCGLEWQANGMGPPAGNGGDIKQSITYAVNTWKVNTVRIPVSQDYWFGYTNANMYQSSTTQNNGYRDAYRAIVDGAISTASNLNCYVELDLHWSGTGAWGSTIGAGQQDMPDDHSIDFWQDVATRYGNNPAVIFNLYNEPKGTLSWALWKNGGNVAAGWHTPGHQNLVKAIRDKGAKNLIVIGGIAWAFDMTGVAANAITDMNTGNTLTGNGIAYEAHIYDNKGGTDMTSKKAIWNNNVTVAVAAGYCVIIGEFGPLNTGTQDNAGCTPFEADLIAWINGTNPQSYVYNAIAWCWHQSASPKLIKDWTFTPTDCHGLQVKNWLAAITPLPTCGSNSPTYTPVVSPTFTRTYTPTASQTNTRTSTRTPSSTPTFTSTRTAVISPTFTATRTFTRTATPANTFTFTATRTNTRTATPTVTQSMTKTVTPTQQDTFTATPTGTYTRTATYTITKTFTAGPSSTATPTATRTDTPVAFSPTATHTGTLTRTASFTMTNTRTFTWTATPSRTMTATPTESPVYSPTETQTGTPPTETVTPTITETYTDTPVNTVTETDTPVDTESATASVSPTFTNTETRTNTPVDTVTQINSPTRTITVTSTRTFTSTASPTMTLTLTLTSTAAITPTATLIASGNIGITEATVYPCPLQNSADPIKLRVEFTGVPVKAYLSIYTAGFRRVRYEIYDTGITYPICTLTLAADKLKGLSRGSYYCVLQAEDTNRKKSNKVTKPLIILR